MSRRRVRHWYSQVTPGLAFSGAISERRIIGGRVYRLDLIFDNKPGARKHAASMRKLGYQARILRVGVYRMYGVYVRRWLAAGLSRR